MFKKTATHNSYALSQYLWTDTFFNRQRTKYILYDQFRHDIFQHCRLLIQKSQYMRPLAILQNTEIQKMLQETSGIFSGF